MSPFRGAARAAAFGTSVAWSFGCRHEPTYYDDVRPLLASRCTFCHTKRGVAPVPVLDSFESASAARDQIRVSLQMRDMPPWGAENTGLCGKWRDALWLEDDEARLLEKWARQPLMGDAAHARPAPPRAGPPFHPSGAVLDTGSDFRPGLGEAAYHCFVVAPVDERDRIATAFRFVSTEPRSVEQVTVYALDTPKAEETATQMDERDPVPGYTCYGSPPFEGARLLTSWTWDASVSRLPGGFGVRVPGGRKLLVQIHYNPIATGLNVPTHTKVELELDQSARIATFLNVAPELNLAPGQTHVEARTELAVPRALRLLGVAPRMHTLGKTMQLDRASDAGAWRCTGSFDHWNFYVQRLFVLDAPLELPAGTRLRLSCVFDTTSRSDVTHAGERIEDEECLAQLLVFPG